MTWVNAMGSGMHFQRVGMWFRAEVFRKRFLIGCVVWVCFAYQELAASRGIPNSQWCWGILTRVRGPPHQSRGHRDNPSSGLCLSTSACPLWRGPHGPESWSWPPLCPPKSLMKKLELLFWKLSKEDLDALLSLQNWWENRCQNPVVDLVNLPAPKISRDCRERQMPLQLTGTGWCHTSFKVFFYSLRLFVFAYSKTNGGDGEKKPT